VPDLPGNGWSVLGPLYAQPTSDEVDVRCDAPVQVLDGLPGGFELAAREMTLRSSSKGSATARLTARLVLPEPSELAAADVTLRIGEVWQTIPASAWQTTATGCRYEDASGFFRLVEYDAAAATLRVEGGGPMPDGARFGKRRVVLSLESDVLRIAHAVDVVRRGGALVLRKPE
jgi:hypothetical protein